MLKVYIRIFVSKKGQQLRDYKRSKVNRVKLTQSVRDDGKNRCVFRRLIIRGDKNLFLYFFNLFSRTDFTYTRKWRYSFPLNT